MVSSCCASFCKFAGPARPGSGTWWRLQGVVQTATTSGGYALWLLCKSQHRVLHNAASNRPANPLTKPVSAHQQQEYQIAIQSGQSHQLHTVYLTCPDHIPPGQEPNVDQVINSYLHGHAVIMERPQHLQPAQGGHC